MHLKMSTSQRTELGSIVFLAITNKNLHIFYPFYSDFDQHVMICSENKPIQFASSRLNQIPHRCQVDIQYYPPAIIGILQQCLPACRSSKSSITNSCLSLPGTEGGWTCRTDLNNWDAMPPAAGAGDGSEYLDIPHGLNSMQQLPPKPSKIFLMGSSSISTPMKALCARFLVHMRQ